MIGFQKILLTPIKTGLCQGIWKHEILAFHHADKQLPYSENFLDRLPGSSFKNLPGKDTILFLP
jgi:hypothetical protein